MNKYAIPTGIIFTVIFLTNCTSQNERIIKEIEKQARQLPKMLSSALRIDNITLDPNTNTLEYHYTVFNDSIISMCNNEETQKRMAMEIKRSSSMAKFRNQKMNFKYIYISGESKEILLRIYIPESMYKNYND